ncbi:MAG: NFACT family protein [Anaerorhabdus sp.]
MALDGILLSKILDKIQNFLPARINKIYQISNTELIFQLKTTSGKENLLISCHSIYNRITITKRDYNTPNEPSNFVMLLRKYLESSKIVSIKQEALDRWCKIKIDSRSEIGDPVTYYLFIELMGKYANIIFTDSEYRIMDALKRIPPFNNKRTIQPGAKFIEIEKQLDKKDPFIEKDYDKSVSLVKQFHGISPLLEKEIYYRLEKETFSSIFKEIKNSNNIYLYKTNNETFFHCINLTHKGKCLKRDILDGIDNLYLEKEEKERVKDLVGDIYKYTQRQLKHYKKKVLKLEQALEESLDCEKWRLYGDLLFANQHLSTKGKNTITLKSWDDKEEFSIPIDQRLDIKGNAKKCFQLYNKRKKGQVHINEQIAICKEEIMYFDALSQQLEFANFKDALEIKQELIKLNYLSENKKNTKNHKKKKNTLPTINKITLKNGVVLSFGKNNIQNEALTFSIANKNDMWFHTKDYHGSHVTINCAEPDEETIRIAAMFAAYYSKGRYSSSVPVNYCLVKSLKKIPNSKIGLVSLSKYKTIYIDPDQSLIDEICSEKHSNE